MFYTVLARGNGLEERKSKDLKNQLISEKALK